MNFYLYDLIFLAIFGSFLTVFLIKRRKKLDREGILIIYRTRLGIKAINYISKKFRKFIDKSEYIVIFVGYALMIVMFYLLLQLLYVFASSPQFVRAIKMPPIMPLVPYIPSIFKIDFLPPFYFTYWIVVLAITAMSHEFFHGIFARKSGVNIKSTGFAFLGPFAGAFVEPDENKVKKTPIKNQLAFLAAGSFANVLVAGIFFIVIWIFFTSTFIPSGVIFNTYSFNIVNLSSINLTNEKLDFSDKNLTLTKVFVGNKTFYINQKEIENLKNETYPHGIAEKIKNFLGLNHTYTEEKKVVAFEDTPALKARLEGVIIEINGNKIKNYEDLGDILGTLKPGQEIEIKTLVGEEIKTYNLILGESPNNKNRVYLGIALINTQGKTLLSKIKNKLVFFKDPNTYYKAKRFPQFTIFLYNLIWWLILINISVALFNMLPVGIFDGGRVFFLTVKKFTNEKKAKKAYLVMTYLILFIFLFLMLLWFYQIFL